MTPLRQKMIHELELHRNSPRTVDAYVTAVAQLAQHYGRGRSTSWRCCRRRPGFP